MSFNRTEDQDKAEVMEVSEKQVEIDNSFMSPPPSKPENNVQNKSTNLTCIPYQHSSENIPSTPQNMTQSHLSGEVTLTPTNRSFTPQAHSSNPHSSMSAITPMASAVNQAKSSIKFQNCVSTVSLGCELKLLDIYCRTRYSEYNPARFHGVVMKILEPRATALVFRSGKIVCTGARNEHDSYIAARKFARIIQKLGFPVTAALAPLSGLDSSSLCEVCRAMLMRLSGFRNIHLSIKTYLGNKPQQSDLIEMAKFLNFKVQNFIATADLRFPVRLEALQQAHGQFTSYEPELFPGLVYRMIRPRVVLLIFVNGKIVITGGKTKNEVYEAVDILHPILRSFKKN